MSTDGLDRLDNMPRSNAEARRLYRVAAEKGDSGAQRWLGLMYAQGPGRLRDFAQARRWLRAAADQGDATAQFHLGLMYYKGEGGPKDPTEARRWFRSATEQGHEDAQHWLVHADLPSDEL